MQQLVRCFLRNDENKYLLVKHKNKNYWSLPWGHIEKKENIYKALKREIKEELNLNIKILWNKLWINVEWLKEKPAPLCTYKFKYINKKGKQEKRLEYIFLAKIIPWEIILQEEEIDKIYYFSKEELLSKKEIFSQIKEIIKCI